MATKSQLRRDDDQQQLTAEEEINELDLKLERLRILYEQFFVGVEKMEPTTLRREVERYIRKLQQIQINNTGLRFRFQNQQSRLQIFSVHWGRVLRQIEAGTWKRARSRDAIIEENMPPAMKMARKRRQRRLAVIADRRRLRGDVANEDLPSEDVDLEEEELPPLPVVDGEVLQTRRGSRGVKAVAAAMAATAARKAAAPPPVAKPAAPAPLPVPPAAVAKVSPPPPLPPAAVAKASPPAPPPLPPPLPPAAAKAPAPTPAAPAKVAAPTPTPAAAAKAPAPTPTPATAAKVPAPRQYEAVFKEFLDARKQAGQTGDVGYESLAKTLAGQAETLRTQKKWRDVRFRVAVENGKVVVKASRGDGDKE